MKDVIKKDLYRFYGDRGETLPYRVFRKPELKFLIALRRAHNSKNPIAHLRLYRLSHKTGIQIPARTEIGEGFYIGHFGRVIIHPDSVIGKNVNIGTGVTMGRKTAASVSERRTSETTCGSARTRSSLEILRSARTCL